MTDKNKKFGIKRETRTDSENEPNRVYRPRTLKAQPVSTSNESVEKTGLTEERESTPFETEKPKNIISDESTSQESKTIASDENQPRKITYKKKEESSSEGKSTYKPRTFTRVSSSEDDKSSDIQPVVEQSTPNHPEVEDRVERTEKEASEERPTIRKRIEIKPKRTEDRTYARKTGDGDRTSRRTDGKSTGYLSTKENRKGDRPSRNDDDRDQRYGDSTKPFGQRSDFEEKSRFEKPSRDIKKPYGSRSESDKKPQLRLVHPETRERKYIDKPISKPKREYDDKPYLEVDSDGKIRLNKFISNTGLCSRREADDFIKEGMISVNGEIVNQVGTKIDPASEVCFKGKKLETEHKVYILLNKPKDYITTVEDPNAKRTVMELIEGACTERVYPVGRLDRNSTGLLLLTNDGEMTKRLTHPSHMKKKIYHVGLDRVLAREDMEKMLSGVEVEGEIVKADAVEYVEETDGSEVGVEIHTGQNRVVRNMFDTLGYKVSRLDRVYFAGLTKKNLPRGKWRFLSQKEINMLKMNRFE